MKNESSVACKSCHENPVASTLLSSCAESTADRQPVVHDILVRRGILAGGARLTIIGLRMNEYPVLGARFKSHDDDDLPELYGYAVPADRFL